MTTQDVSMARAHFDISAAAAASPKVSAGFTSTLARWFTRARQRAELANLDEQLRRDIGVSTADVWRETKKPFWRE